MTNLNKYLLVVVGPTAVGKTTLCIRLAQHFDTEIVSADSRQFYREMAIGTAKPTSEELAQAPHHLIDSQSIMDDYNVGDYEKDALVCLEDIFARKQVAILTGGSGLYIQAVCDGIDEMPEVAPEIRAQLMGRLQQEGLEPLLQQLEQLDPVYYQQVDQANPHRVVRALEVCLSTGQPYSSFRKKNKVQRPFNILKIGLERDREELYERINLRMDLMLEQGLLEEVKALYPYKNHNALQTVGYKEIFDYMDNKHDWDEAVRLLKRNSRRYAKRQMTWFRRDEEIHWFSPQKVDTIIDWVDRRMSD
ncbi:tRNA (adenosine(37)-N6)-dimethylallyltransferase MiaA [Microscilla marina]|uniref:tRNA dimethylallyltransferase n=1 Tax=Microscilla marina ATCC 23134 TaxID=313606 RepID=A1ZKB9_MICM2|nr:tRNA (adenosine(37)-N6)-dimethylallyltransferase MiaA [Microscilla marina]EAY29145.1 tRNA delta(2)-isopentenylpyrophosphate transferase [Microscilla marina ATCC 23134]